MKKTSIEELSTQFGLSVEFLTELETKVVDKENFARAVKMFADGLLPYDMATGKDPINVAKYRKTVAKNLREFRHNQQEKVKAAMEQHRNSLRSTISNFFKFSDKLRSLSIEEMEKIVDIIKDKT